MQTTIQQVSPVEYELVIQAPAEELAPELDKALRAQRARTNLKGFRPGKVPMSYVKKMFGRALVYEIAEREIQKAYMDNVVAGKEYQVLGRPTIAELDVDVDKELKATLRFGVRPEFDLADVAGQELPRLAVEVDDAEVEKYITRMQEDWSELVPDDAPVSEQSFVLVDLQRLDDATHTPIIGDKESDVGFFLKDERLKEDLKNALIGTQVGSTFQVDLPHEHQHAEVLDEGDAHEGHDHPHEPHSHRYEVTVKEVKQRELIPMDEAFAQRLSNGAVESPDALKPFVRAEMEKQYRRQSRQMLEDQLIDRMVKANQIDVAESAIDAVVEGYIDEYRERNKGKLPENFDVEQFATAYHDRAATQVRWMLIRDKVAKEEQIQVEDDDIRAFWKEQDPETFNDEMIEYLLEVYKKDAQRAESVRERILTQKVIDTLVGKFDVKDLSSDDYMKRLSDENPEA